MEKVNEGHPEILALVYCILVLLLLCRGGGVYKYFTIKTYNTCITATVIKSGTLYLRHLPSHPEDCLMRVRS